MQAKKQNKINASCIGWELVSYLGHPGGTAEVMLPLDTREAVREASSDSRRTVALGADECVCKRLCCARAAFDHHHACAQVEHHATPRARIHCAYNRVSIRAYIQPCVHTAKTIVIAVASDVSMWPLLLLVFVLSLVRLRVITMLLVWMRKLRWLCFIALLLLTGRWCSRT